MSKTSPKPPSTPKGDQTRQRMLSATGHLLQSQGYFATGLKQILTESNAPRGSLYFHFPGGKEQLACAALSQAGADWRGRLQAITHGPQPLEEALVSACEYLADVLQRSEFTEGCPVATVTLEAAASVDAVQDVCAHHFAEWHAFIKAELEQLHLPPADHEALSTHILSAIEGALILCRAQRATTPLRHVARSLSFTLAQYAKAAPQ